MALTRSRFFCCLSPPIISGKLPSLPHPTALSENDPNICFSHATSSSPSNLVDCRKPSIVFHPPRSSTDRLDGCEDPFRLSKIVPFDAAYFQNREPLRDERQDSIGKVGLSQEGV